MTESPIYLCVLRVNHFECQVTILDRDRRKDGKRQELPDAVSNAINRTMWTYKHWWCGHSNDRSTRSATEDISYTTGWNWHRFSIHDRISGYSDMWLNVCWLCRILFYLVEQWEAILIRQIVQTNKNSGMSYARFDILQYLQLLNNQCVVIVVYWTELVHVLFINRSWFMCYSLTGSVDW